MASLKSAKNLIGSETEYSRHYSDFRGVDFSSESTQVHEKRLAYLVNMYRDYQTGQGEALETIPGFRKRFIAPLENGTNASSPIYGIFQFDHRKFDTKENKILVEPQLIIHAGKYLYAWKDGKEEGQIPFSEDVNVPVFASVKIGNVESGEYYLAESVPEGLDSKDKIVSVKSTEGTNYREYIQFEAGGSLLCATPNITLNIEYYKNIVNTPLFIDMNNRKSVSFVFNNNLYILDGKNYLVYDGTSVSYVATSETQAVAPIRYQQIQVGENANTGSQYQQANLLNPYGIFTFVADGVTKNYQFPIPIEGIEVVSVYGTEITENIHFDKANNTLVFEDDAEAPKKPLDENHPEDFAGVEVVAVLYDEDTQKSKFAEIMNCTIAEVYDDRVFLSGNPRYPNRVWFSAVNTPSYFGEIDFEQEGVSNSPITGIMTISDSLLVLKGDSAQEPTVYFLSAVDTGNDLKPKAYASQRGISGVGCLGACRNFLDDAVFISRLGLEAVGQLSVRLERAREHRSSLVDAKLTNADLKNASMCEYGGYLWVLVGDEIFLADSRQRWQNSLGNAEYEWYYLSGIATYTGQTQNYYYSENYPKAFERWGFSENGVYYPILLKEGYGKVDVKDVSKVFSATIEDDGITYHFYAVKENGNYYLCDTRGDMTGGQKQKTTVIAMVNNNVYFGTEDGTVCSFNFDLRDKKLGVIPTKGYAFDGRKYISGCATLLDNCGIPHLTKSTIKRSTVIKTKAFSRSAAKVRVKTNKNPFKQIARITNSTFLFDDIDFSDFSFITTDETIFSIKEKEKHWVEKQYYIYSDEYHSPFALHNVSFRYKVAGRIKG